MLEITPRTRELSRSSSLCLQRKHPRIWPRVVITLLLSPFLILSLLIPRDALSQPGTSLFHVCVAVGFMFLAYGFLLGLWWLAGAVTGHWTRIEWNTDEEVLEATFHGSWIWMVRTWRVPFRDIQEVWLSFGTGGEKETAASFAVRYGPHGAKPGTLHLPLLISGLNLRTEVVDLAFRIARAMRWKAYRVRRNDHMKLEVELLPFQRGEALAIPEVGAVPDYHDDAASPGKDMPELTFPPFVPGKFAGPSSIREWRPGHLVRFEKVPVPRGKAMTLVAVMMALFTVPVLLALFFFGDTPMGGFLLIPAVEAPLFGGIVLYLVYKGAREAREVTLDWRARTVRVRTERRTVEYPLADIRSLAVRGSVVLSYETAGDDRRSYHEYGCEVVGCLSGGDEVRIAETDRSRDADVPYLACGSMAAALAAALGIEWQWDDYRSP